MSEGLLSGIRVLDLTNVLAGPFCAYQLALLGADVIKVEPPGSGDLARQLGASAELSRQKMGASFLAQNANKRSLTLNLKAENGKAIFLDLVDTADVLVENFRPGVMDRLGLGPATLTERNPRLVYCAISGFGQEGPMRGSPAYDQIIQGLSGTMSITGDADSAPLRVGYPMCDSIGGMTGAFAIAAALAARGRTGKGTVLDVSMLDSTIATMGWVVSNLLIVGQQPVPMGNDNFTAAPSGTFQAADGPLNISANKQEQFEALADLLGAPEWIGDPRFAEREARKANRAALTEAIEAKLATRSAAAWEELLNGRGVPAGRVLSVEQALGLEQVKQRELIHHFPDADLSVVKAGFRADHGGPELRFAPRTLGADTDELLRELGFDAARIAALKEAAVV